MLMKIYQMGDKKLGPYFPTKQRPYEKGEALLLVVSKCGKKVEQITKFNYNIVLRKSFLDELDLKREDIVDVQIEKIDNLERSKELFCKDKIDLLYLIPERTAQGYEIIVLKFFRDEISWLKIWYAHERGSGRQIELKRFVDIDKFGRLLGQYQAEGTKHKNTKKKFYFQFSNKLVEEHRNYLDYLKELGIPKERTEFKLSYNPTKYPKNIISKYLQKFNELINLKLKVSPEEQNKGMGFACTIRNTLLTEIILHSMDKVRVLLANTKNYSPPYQKLVNAFFAKLLTGDGTMDIRTKDREYDYPTTRITIIDQDMVYLEDYKQIMKNLLFIPRIVVEHIYVRAHAGLHQLLYLYKIEAFKNTNNWDKLLVNIDLVLQGRRLSTLKRYLDLADYEAFDTLELAEAYDVTKSAAYDWLSNATKTGYIKKITKKPIPNKPIIWTTTNKAKKLSSTLQLWQRDLEILKKEKGIQDSFVLLESLKIKNKKGNSSNNPEAL